MNHTTEFLKSDFQFNPSTPTENLARFEPVAIQALNDLQNKITEGQSELEFLLGDKDRAIIEASARIMTANPAGLSGVARIESVGKQHQQKTIQESAAKGMTLLTMSAIEGSPIIIFYFMEPGVTRESLAEQVKVLAEKAVTAPIESLQARIKNLTDDMKSLKKAVQARHAEIKPFLKVLADY